MTYLVPITPHEVNVAVGKSLLFVVSEVVYIVADKDGIPVNDFDIYREKDLNNINYKYTIIPKNNDWLNRFLR